MIIDRVILMPCIKNWAFCLHPWAPVFSFYTLHLVPSRSGTGGFYIYTEPPIHRMRVKSRTDYVAMKCITVKPFTPKRWHLLMANRRSAPLTLITMSAQHLP
ncbi:hypothetical protein GGU45_002046 [Niabella hirudinis]